ncbi:hypothetical protein K505DRAFT_297692 [Melanomma pulvis-pyrius CBS 109.77]|uniref:Rhodopsin domain-containing protein n=1 Tax=Melanomma pulvis-pyrius CBS 109.77 TaxID=1314802 RepID=A0A6A6XNU2_9PLEO|nr:hypothetical protein K505DRAFT_297692 [Melanomma pulvis-pyrius CBS 109.77]
MAPNVGLGAQGDEQRGWGLWLASVVGVLISACFVGARIAQRISKTGLGLDDYMIMASLVASGLLSMTECQAVVYGFGRKYATLPHDSRITARKWFYGAQIMYKVVLMLNKISMVCLYYRIFAISSKKFRIACHALNGFIIASGMAFIIGTIFQCTPISYFWDRRIPGGGRCFNNEPWWISYSVVQILTDVFLLVLPIQQVFTLSMTKTEKLGLSLIFGTGIFVTFASIYRATTLAMSANNPDPTWGPVPATVWSVIEPNAGIICTCLPMLRHPFIRLFGPLFGSSSRSRSRSNQQSLRLTSRSHQRSAQLASGKHAASDSVEDFERESEENIIGIDGNTSRTEGIETPDGNGIMVKNEFSVTRSESFTNDTKKHRRDKQDGEISVATSVNEDDKTSGKSTFLHL